jgi:hypothetical protein
MMKIDVIEVDEIAPYYRNQVSTVGYGRNVIGSRPHISHKIPGHLYENAKTDHDHHELYERKPLVVFQFPKHVPPPLTPVMFPFEGVSS